MQAPALVSRIVGHTRCNSIPVRRITIHGLCGQTLQVFLGTACCPGDVHPRTRRKVVVFTCQNPLTEPVFAAAPIPPLPPLVLLWPPSVRHRAQQLRAGGQAGQFFRGTSTQWGGRSRRRGGWWCPMRRRGRGGSPPRSPQTCRCASFLGSPSGGRTLRPSICVSLLRRPSQLFVSGSVDGAAFRVRECAGYFKGRIQSQA